MQTPHAAISQAAQALLERAGDNTRLVNAINKAELALKSDVAVVACADGWLVSSTRGEHVYRVNNVYGCPCKAGTSGKPCYHAQAVELMIEAGKYTMPVLRSRVVYEPDTSDWF